MHGDLTGSSRELARAGVDVDQLLESHSENRGAQKHRKVKGAQAGLRGDPDGRIEGEAGLGDGH